jgi:uncharacterized membrane protein YjjP (DUF1212 family)
MGFSLNAVSSALNYPAYFPLNMYALLSQNISWAACDGDVKDCAGCFKTGLLVMLFTESRVVVLRHLTKMFESYAPG